jgi:hypothetical protein
MREGEERREHLADEDEVDAAQRAAVAEESNDAE